MFFKKETLFEAKKSTLLLAVQYINDEALFVSEALQFIAKEKKKITEQLQQFEQKSKKTPEGFSALENSITYESDLDYIYQALLFTVKNLQQAKADILSEKNSISAWRIYISDPMENNILITEDVKKILCSYPTYIRAAHSQATFVKAQLEARLKEQKIIDVTTALSASLFLLIASTTFGAIAGLICMISPAFAVPAIIICTLASAIINFKIFNVCDNYTKKQIELQPKISLSQHESSLFPELDRLEEHLEKQNAAHFLKNAA